MGKNIFELVEQGDVVKTATVSIDDFIPIVEIDENQLGKSNKDETWKYEGFEILSNKDNIELSNLIDKLKRKRKLYTIQFNAGVEEIVVRFNIKQGYKKSSDKDGIIRVEAKGVTLKTKKQIEIKYEQTIALRLSSKDLQENAYIDFYADDDGGFRDTKGKQNIFCGRVQITQLKLGYPIIRITKQKEGKARQRIIGYTGKLTQYTMVDTYKATLIDSKFSKLIKTFQVTRDAFAVKKSDYSPQKLILSNFAFEPKNGERNHYSGKYMDSYPYKPVKNDTPAIKLMQNDSEVMFAEANQDAVELGYRTKKDVTAGIMIHVGGVYNNEKWGIVTGASEGCFGIVNIENSEEQTSDSTVIEILKKIKEMADNAIERKGHIRIIIEKRMQNEIPNKLIHTRRY